MQLLNESIMKNIKYILIISIIVFAGCKDDYLEKKPFNILTDEIVWTKSTLVEGVLANLYSRIPVDAFNETILQQSDELMWSGSGDGSNRTGSIPTTWYQLYDYALMMEINQFIEKATASSLESKAKYIAEARFLRAHFYFELVKRMGGVPLVTKTYAYQGPESIGDMQMPRNSEAEVYDFIFSELEAVKTVLPADKNPDRATKWAALALQSRAMLYAGSLAKYNTAMSQPVSLQGGVVGIPASKANDYYSKALTAAEQIITEGGFGLESDYYTIFNKKNKTEVIYAVDYKVPSTKHYFTYWNSTPSAKEDNEEGSHLTPFLETVEAYEYLDGTPGTLKLNNSDGTPVYYSNPEDLFKNKDLRLQGSILYQNQMFRNKRVSLQTGQMVFDEAGKSKIVTGTLGQVDANNRLITGWDGPSENLQWVSNTGFYLKKFVSTAAGAGQRSTMADNWWPVFRYSEILLNASEAALVTGKESKALEYINIVRNRAGFGVNSLKTMTLANIINERRVELAFEGHRYFDLKRWRIAEQVISGIDYSCLNCYLVVNPGNPNDGKYVFSKKPAPRLFGMKRKFEWTNYYSLIPQTALDRNPKLIKNPGH